MVLYIGYWKSHLEGGEKLVNRGESEFPKSLQICRQWTCDSPYKSIVFFAILAFYFKNNDGYERGKCIDSAS